MLRIFYISILTASGYKSTFSRGQIEVFVGKKYVIVLLYYSKNKIPVMNPVESYISHLESDQLDLCSYLHDVMLHKYNMSCKLRYGIPFYDLNKWLVYIKPLKQGGVELCFLHGRWMKDEQGLLKSNGRKQIKGVVYAALTDIDEEALFAAIDEAVVLDKEFKDLKRLPK